MDERRLKIDAALTSTRSILLAPIQTLEPQLGAAKWKLAGSETGEALSEWREGVQPEF